MNLKAEKRVLMRKWSKEGEKKQDFQFNETPACQ